jgi:UDP-N-acetylglucosamine 2-epimerase (non-hydrolysing)
MHASSQAGKPRVLVVIGTRPEGIKLAPVVRALERRVQEVEVRTALTGQHTDLMDQVLQVFELRPHWDLGIMREGQDLYDVTHGCLEGLRAVLTDWQPDLVVVEGDTASVFLGGLVAFYERTAVGHVEAGLRSGDKWRPYPEEIFRRLTGVLTDLHFAPTPLAAANLQREGVDPSNVFVTGNTVVDALLWAAEQEHVPMNAELQAALEDGKRLVLLTAHRRESFGEPLRRALEAVRDLADAFPDTVVLYPVHPNPNVRNTAQTVLSGHVRIRLTEPLDYLDLVAALKQAALVITDSGGIQEEAPILGKRVIVLRDVTERPEAVDAGFARLAGTDPVRIAFSGALALGEGAESAWPLSAGNPYGDGHAGERIADIIIHRLSRTERSTRDWPGLGQRMTAEARP